MRGPTFHLNPEAGPGSKPISDQEYEAMSNRRGNVTQGRLAAWGTGLAALLLIAGCGGEPAVDEEMDYDQPIVAEGDLVESEPAPPETDQLVPAPTDAEAEQPEPSATPDADAETPAEADDAPGEGAETETDSGDGSP